MSWYVLIYFPVNLVKKRIFAVNMRYYGRKCRGEWIAIVVGNQHYRYQSYRAFCRLQYLYGGAARAWPIADISAAPAHSMKNHHHIMGTYNAGFGCVGKETCFPIKYSKFAVFCIVHIYYTYTQTHPTVLFITLYTIQGIGKNQGPI